MCCICYPHKSYKKKDFKFMWGRSFETQCGLWGKNSDFRDEFVFILLTIFIENLFILTLQVIRIFLFFSQGKITILSKRKKLHFVDAKKHSSRPILPSTQEKTKSHKRNNTNILFYALLFLHFPPITRVGSGRYNRNFNSHLHLHRFLYHSLNSLMYEFF